MGDKMDNKIVKFECSPKGLYQMEVTRGYRDDLEGPTTSTSNLISTVAENRKGYTLRQLREQKKQESSTT
jgi:hypothetical protein